MKCPKCKKKLRRGTEFCPSCGARIEKKRGIRFLPILLVLLLLLSTVVLGWSGSILFAKYFHINFKGLFSGKETIEIHNVEEAIEHARELGEEYGYDNAMSELTEKVVTTIDGDNYYRLQQNYQGLPVYGRTIIYATNENGMLASITGNVSDITNDVDIVPSITFKQAVSAVNAYFYNNYGIDDICRNIPVNTNEGKLCVYNMAGESLLAYSISAGGYEVLVDAHNKKIISTRQTINSNSENIDLCKNDSDYAWKNSNDTYILRDIERNIYIYDAKKNTYWNIDTDEVNPNVLSFVTSKDDTFGNKDDNTSTSSKAISFLRTLVSVYDYYQSKLSNETGCGAVAGIYDDALGSYNGKNAGGGIMDVESTLPSIPPGYNSASHNGEIGVIIMGTKYSDDFRSATDILGHEYTHIVTDKYLNWCHSSIVDQKTNVLTESNSENGAIREGLSDIFGELIELHVLGKTDWTNKSRTIYDPSLNGYPEKYGKAERNEDGWVTIGKGVDYAHGYSVIISRAAYLMWNGIDGDSSKKISADNLSKLWYRTMLMMPSDCEFIECRHLAEIAAQSMDCLTDKQISCVSEAFDAVGIYSYASIGAELTYQLKPGSTLSILDKNGQQYYGYNLEVNGLRNTILCHENLDGMQEYYIGGTYYSYSTEVDNAPMVLDIPYGYYNFTISDRYHPELSYSFSASIDQSGVDDEVTLYTDYEKPLIVKVTESDAYQAYALAVKRTTESGTWSENLSMTANMAITDGNAKTKTKVTLTSDADVSNYSESNLSQIHISGSAEMTAMGQTYAWEMEYENGTAHYRYTKPDKTSTDMKIDPSFFNFEILTSDMMTNAKLSGNKITFTVPGEKIAEVGIAAVNQMSGVDNLEYGDVDVIVLLSDDNKIDNVIMVFHASLQYQGYDADVDYDIEYRFSDGFRTSSKPVLNGVPIIPGIYAQDGSTYNTLTIHETDGSALDFTAFWYRIADISNASAMLNSNVASFDYISPVGNWRVKGTMMSPSEKTIVLTISDSTHEYINIGEYRYSLIGKKLTDTELKAISMALNVPSNLDIQIIQGEPAYWDGGEIYRTPIDIYYNGELIAGANVNSLTGEIVDNITMYSAPDT